MFASPRLYYVALPKTGGTRILTLLPALVPGSRPRGKHERIRGEDLVPGRRFAGSIRSPWAYYVSLWAYGCAGHGGIRVALAEHPASAEWYGDPRDPAPFRRWLPRVLCDHEALALTPPRVRKNGAARFAGLLTLRFAEWYWRPDAIAEARDIPDLDAFSAIDQSACFVDDFIRQERLGRDLLAAVNRAGFAVDADTFSLVMDAPTINTTGWTGRLADYYDDELVALVAKRERFVIERFGYAPPPR